MFVQVTQIEIGRGTELSIGAMPGQIFDCARDQGRFRDINIGSTRCRIRNEAGLGLEVYRSTGSVLLNAS